MNPVTTGLGSAEHLMPRYGWLADYVNTLTPLTEAPATTHLATGLALLSAAVGWRAWLDWGGSREPCTLYVVLEGKSARAKKTTAMRMARRIGKSAMADGDDGHPPPVRFASVSHISKVGLLELIAPKDDDQATEWEAEPPPATVLEFDEFGWVLGKPGETKGSEWVGQMRATLMEAVGGYQGGAKSGARHVPASRCAVALMATMTREELEQRVTTGLLRDGFMGRFILVPGVTDSRYIAIPPKMTGTQVRAIDQLSVRLRQVMRSTEQLGDVFARLTDRARNVRLSWYQLRMAELDKAADTGGELEETLAQVMGRLQSVAMKVAAVHAVSRMEPGDTLADVHVDQVDVEFGIHYAEWALAEVASLASLGGKTVRDRYAERVQAWLAKQDDYVKRRDLLAAIRDPELSAQQRWDVVVDLYQQGTVDVQMRTPKRGPETEWVALVHGDGTD